MAKRRQEPPRRQMYYPSPTSEVHYRGKDDGCCGIVYLKYVLYVFNFILLVCILFFSCLVLLSWRRSILVRTLVSAGELSLSCARLLAGRVTTLWLSRQLSVNQHGQLSLPSLRGRLNSSSPYYSGLRRQTAGMVRGVTYRSRPPEWR